MSCNQKLIHLEFICVSIVLLVACGSATKSLPEQQATEVPTIAIPTMERTQKIPATAVKMTPGNDKNPPLIYSAEYESPVPVPGLVNTSGAEDSPFITPDGKTLYFFFTPDVKVPVEKQIVDGVTGIYVSHKVNGEWIKAERITLQDPRKPALDGCEFVQGDVMWFCSTRETFTGIHWFTAEYANGIWQGWKLADFDPTFQVGELHFSADGTKLYFGSERPGGKGGLDLWISHLVGGEWQPPINLSAVNTADSEGWPALNPAGDELWFTRNYGIWRSKNVNGEWQPAELVVSPLAGEPTLDEDGNLYFVHHYFTNDQMIEADIYVSYKK